MSHRYLEDFTPGFQFETAGATITESQILDFAMQWDPQPFHLDATAAEQSVYGGLIASGWQTVAVTFRLVLAEKIWNHASMGSPGVDELRWLLPVRPGDTLRMRGEVVENRPSRSKPDRGIVTIAYSALNQRDEVVLTYKALHMLRARPS